MKWKLLFAFIILLFIFIFTERKMRENEKNKKVLAEYHRYENIAEELRTLAKKIR